MKVCWSALAQPAAAVLQRCAHGRNRLCKNAPVPIQANPDEFAAAEVLPWRHSHAFLKKLHRIFSCVRNLLVRGKHIDAALGLCELEACFPKPLHSSILPFLPYFPVPLSYFLFMQEASHASLLHEIAHAGRGYLVVC